MPKIALGVACLLTAGAIAGGAARPQERPGAAALLKDSQRQRIIAVVCSNEDYIAKMEDVLETYD